MARRRTFIRRSGPLLLELPVAGGPNDQPRRRRRRWFRISAIVFLLMLTLSSAMVYGFITAITTNLPDLRQFDADAAEPAQDGSIWVKGTSGGYEQIATLRSSESRIIVGSSQIGQVMKDATVAVEDRRFYVHNGVDLPGIARAIFKRFTSGTNEGASTITQQLIKNTYLTNTQTVERKVREASLAWQLEQRWSKDRILTAYLNTVYFGHNTYGVESASRYYFDTSAANLDAADAALLAAILKSPTTYDPIATPDVALARRNLVLQQMGEQNFLDPDTVAVEQGRRLLPVTRTEPIAPETSQPYWVQFITEQLVNKFGTGRTFGGGLKVYTTLDLHEQALAQAAIRDTMPHPGPQSALVSIDPKTGEVTAMTGSRRYSAKHQFNTAADAHRQPGSAFKPFVYIAALEKGIRPTSKFLSRRVLYDLGGGQIWYVTNSEAVYGDDLTLPQALAVSDNTIFAQLTMLIKPAPIADVARRVGIITPIDDGQPAIGLGGLFVGVTPLEMAHAYATIANDGQRVGGSILFHTPDSGITDPSMEPISITRIEFPDGSEVVNAPITRQAVSKEDADTTIEAMRRVIAHGTGTNAKIDRPAAGKTGTTTDYKDAWFVGFTPQRATAAWVGYENPAIPMKTQYYGKPVYGGTFPALIWASFMRGALKGMPREGWDRPTGTYSTDVSIDPRTDKRVPPGCRYAQIIVMALDKIPNEVSPCENDLIPVPDFTSSTKAQAINLAIGSGLQLRFDFRPAEPADTPGAVVAQAPLPLSAIQAGSIVTLAIARRIPSVLLPAVIASAKVPSATESAIARLVAAQFRVVVLDQQDSIGLPIGSVVNQDPAPGVPAPLGSVVTLWTSGSYSGALVPDVQGLTVAEAEKLLRKAGLVSQPVNADGLLRPDDRVFRSDPSAGSKVPLGMKITLSVSPI